MIFKKNILIINFFFLKDKISFIIGSLAIIFSLFQNVIIFPFFSSLDTQPYAFIFFLLYIISIKKIYIPFLILIISFLILFSLIFVLFLTYNFNWFEYLRVSVMFISFPVIFVGFYNYLIQSGFPSKIFFFTNLIWFINALFQLYGFDFFFFLVESRGSLFSGRGVASFAKEPFIYGLYLIFTMILYFKNKNYSLKDHDVKIFLLINIFSLFFLCQSFYSILIFLICFFLYLFNFTQKKLFFSIIFFILFLLFSLIFFNQISKKIFRIGDRLNFFVTNFVNADFSILINDTSVKDRLLNLSKSYVSFFNNKFLPHGIDQVNDSIYIQKEKEPDLYSNFYPSTRIWSYVGSYLFYFGFVGFIILILKFYMFACRKYIFSETILVLFIILGNVPLPHSLIIQIFAINYFINKTTIRNK